MKQRNLKSVGCVMITCCAILLLGFGGQGYCEDNGTALMLQMTPAEGGTLNLSTGVHRYDRDAEIKLTAVPKAGYQFVCWQGSVTEATSSSTSVVLDSPKIIIAVFERSKFEIVDTTEGFQICNGGGGMVRSSSEFDTSLEQATGGRRPPHFHLPGPPRNVPVPGKEGDNNFPVPPNNEVPEPATTTFLVMGIILLSKYRRSRTEA